MPESNPALVLFVSVKNGSLCDRCASLFFRTKILSEDSYLKSFIRRVLCSYRERFSSFRASVIRLLAEPFFLAALHRAVRTKAVKGCQHFDGQQQGTNSGVLVTVYNLLLS